MNGAQMVAEAWAASVEVCSRIATRLGMPAAVQKATNCLGEQWGGEGFPNRLKGDAIPIAALIVSPTLVLPPLHRVAGREAVVALVRELRGHAFAPTVCDAFLALAEEERFWAEFESGGIVELVVGM